MSRRGKSVSRKKKVDVIVPRIITTRKTIRGHNEYDEEDEDEYDSPGKEQETTNEVVKKIEQADTAAKPVFPYSEDRLAERLYGRTCVSLRFYARVLRIQMNTVGLNKTQLVTLLTDTMKANWERSYSSVGVGEASHKQYSEAVPSADKQSWTKFAGLSKETPEERLVWGLELTGYRRREGMAARFEQKPCAKRTKMPDGSAVEVGSLVDPAYGAYGSRDCGPGFIQVQAGGCCVRIENLISLWDVEGAENNLSKIAGDLGEGEALELRNYLAQGTRELDEALSTSSFKSRKEAKFVMEVLSTMQNQMTTRLGQKLDELLQQGGGGDVMCEDVSGGEGGENTKSASGFLAFLNATVADPVLRGLKGLWWVMRKVFGFLWSTMRVVVGGVARGLKSMGEKIAYFLVSNPRQARVMFAVAKQFRDRACTWLGEHLITWGVFETLNEAGLEQQAAMEKRDNQSVLGSASESIQTAAVQGLELLRDAGTLDPARLAEAFVGQGFFKGGLKYSSRLLSGVLSSIPIVGGGLEVAGEIVGELMSEAVDEGAKFALEVLVYQNDFFETLTLLADIVDLNRCLSKMPIVRFRFPGLHWYLEQAVLATAQSEAKGLGATPDEARMNVAKQRALLDEQSSIAHQLVVA